MADKQVNRPSRALAPPYFAVAAILIALWTAMTVIVVVTFALSNRPGEERQAAASAASDTPTATETRRTMTATPVGDGRPQSVPAAARLVTAAADFGSTSASSTASHLFFNWRCSGNAFAIATSRETIYAELPCNRYWLSDDQSRPFLGKPVRVQLTTTSFRVEATGAGVIGLPATRVWIETR